MLRRFASFSFTVASLLAAPAIALAGPAIAPVAPGIAADPAQTSFDQGVADMEAGRFEKACPAIEASQRLAPMPGTLFTLAECEAARGRIATAMRYYSEYLALFRTFTAQKKLEQKERAVTSTEQLRKLGLLVPRLTLTLPADAGTDVVVKRDGEIVAELSLATALAVDPGEHVLSAQAPGGPEVEQRITLAPGESRTVELSLRRAPEPAPAPVPTVLAPLATVTRSPPPPPDLRPWRIGTWSAGAAGIVGLTVGAVAGVLAIEQRGVMNRHCKPDGTHKDICDAMGIEAKSRLESFGAASTVGFVAGGVGVGIGLALIVATPSMPTSPVNVGPNPPATSGNPAHAAGASPLLRLNISGKF